jgi:predicted transcriptional regulator
MPKSITLRIPDEEYERFTELARRENRPLSNFIETAVLKYIESQDMADEFEMEEIIGNRELRKGLNRGIKDAEEKRGRFV